MWLLDGVPLMRFLAIITRFCNGCQSPIPHSVWSMSLWGRDQAVLPWGVLELAIAHLCYLQEVSSWMANAASCPWKSM